MAYQEILAPASPAAIIDAIATFAQANGWTVERNTLAGSNRTLTLKRPETDYIHVYNLNTTEIRALGSIDYSAARTPEQTTRRSRPAVANIGSGPYTKVYLFADSSPSPYIYAVIETGTAGVYRQIAFGLVDKIEPFTGGTFIDASWWYGSGHSPAPSYQSGNHALFGYDLYGAVSDEGGSIRCDFAADNRVDQWFGIGSGEASGTGAFCEIRPNDHLSALVAEADDNNFSNRSILHPIGAMVNRVGGYYSRIGSFPNIRFCSIRKYNPADEITIGSDIWKIFPMCRKWNANLKTSWPDYEAHSDYFAYAFKKT